MNIVIAGMTCSGKTTLANIIKQNFKDALVMCEDDYMKDLKDMPHLRGYYLMDVPSSYHLKEFKSDVKDLLVNGKALYPLYDVRHNKRLGKYKPIFKKNINIFEGLHTIYALDQIENLFKIFMDIDAEICLKRRIMRDAKIYGANPKDTEKYFNEIIRNIFHTHIEKQKDMADIVIKKEDDVKCLVRKLPNFY